MAFPNPDKTQTYINPKTGVEYSYDDGVWRPSRGTPEDPDEYLKKPYVTYVGDTPPTEGIHQDKQLRDGELWYSTKTNELFARGGDNWWPTSVDYQTEINRIDIDLGYKLSKDRDNIIPSGFNLKKEGGSDILKFADNKLYIRYVATPTSSTSATSKEYVDTSISAAMPIGSIVFWGGTREKIPSGWVECKGQTAPSNVQSVTGLSKIPDLINYMPAGTGGVFGTTAGKYHDSKIERHAHNVTRLEPANTTGYPNGHKDTSSSHTRYWRGNSSSNGSAGSNKTVLSAAVGDDITAPPVYCGVYIFKVS